MSNSAVNQTPAAAANIVSDSTIGTVVTWDFGVGKNHDFVRVERGDIVRLLVEAGYAPSEVGFEDLSVEEALDRCRGVGWGANVKLVRLQAEKGCPASYGVMKTKVGVENAVGEVGARIRIVNGQAEVCAPLAGDPDPDCMLVADKVLAHANDLSTYAVNRDLGITLLLIVRELGGISMRHNSGGAYYLPNSDEANRFIQLLDGIEKLTAHKDRLEQFFAHVTVLNNDPRNVATWHRNTTLSFDLELQKLADELTDMQARDNVRDGTWDKKKSTCVGLVLRANKYADILQGELSRITKAVTALEAEFGKAQDVARATADGAKAVFDKLGDVTPVTPVVPVAPSVAKAPAPAPASKKLNMAVFAKL